MVSLADYVIIHMGTLEVSPRRAPSAHAIARLGAAECLASGITTVGDCSYSGAAATACAELGLRAIVYIEVFSQNGPTTQLETRYGAPRARIEDVLQGKVWAAQDLTRRSSKRQKDLADIARLLEARPDLRALVPGDVLARLV